MSHVYKQEAQEAAGQGPSALQVDYSAAAAAAAAGPPPPMFYDMDIEEPTAGPGVGMLAGPGAELTPQQLIERQQRQWKAGGWSEEMARQRYVTMLLTSLGV